MRCPVCDRQLMLLFYSAVCDWCESPPKGKFFRGYVVWQDPACGEAVSEYVFRTAHDAIVWRTMSGHEEREIRTVLAEEPIPWRVASGRASGLICADQLFDVFTTHRFRRGPYRAFLAPPDCRASKDCVQLTA
ncbi:MAG TPA: hypothetical protein VMF89_00650 [Polyangiales bacterium]|nr:hypothetical protein [Polyangiales bacterium]